MKPEVGNTSVGFGKAFLRPAKEKDHFELCRPLVTVRNEGDRTVTETQGEPMPIAIYRVKRKGDKSADIRGMVAGGPPPEMRTSDPKTNQPMTLVLVWWPGDEKQ